MKAVFDTKPDSGYDDEITRRYHFPSRRNYMAAAEAAVGDWIVYREPQRNNGRRAYIAVARVLGIESDRTRPDHAYAIMGEYLPFDRPVPFAGDGTYWEAPLRAIADPSKVGQGLQGRAMRPLSDADFTAIVSAGLTETLAPENAIRLGLGVEDVAQPFDYTAVPEIDQVRRIEQMLVSRKIRDASFRRQVCEAYEDRCAVTGLRIVNGGGRAEVQAAHIRPVEKDGPDIVQNGIALSATVHWLFDRHLISIAEDYCLLVSHNKVPRELAGLFRPDREPIHLPKDRRLWPAQSFLAYHRDAYAGHN